MAHGTFQGGMAAISGGKFWSGFAAGALNSIAASAWSGGDTITDNGNYTISITKHAGLGEGTGDLGMIAFGSVSGGAGAKLAGGNFWQGAVTGLVVAGLNHAVHKMNSSVRVYDDDGDYIGRIKVLKYKNTNNGVEIELGFKASRSSKYTDYNWVQTVRTDHPLGGTSQTYTDPRPNDDNLPFYYTRTELAAQTNTSRGYSVEFYDNPNRGSIRNSWWKGELSLVGKFNNSLS